MRVKYEWALQRLQVVVDGLAVVLFLGMFILVLAAVAFRTAGDPLVFADELTRYLFVWVALLAWSIAARRASHISINLVTAALPRHARFVLEMISHVAVLGFAAVLVVQGTRMTIRNMDIETITLFFNFSVVYAAAPVAGTLVALETVRQAMITVCAYVDAEVA